MALSLFRDLDGATPTSCWHHWIVGVETIGRITLPVGARRFVGTESSFQAISIDLALILRRGGMGARVAVDHRGRLVLPIWLQRAIGPAGSVLVAARSAGAPMVVVARTGLLDELVENVASQDL